MNYRHQKMTEEITKNKNKKYSTTTPFYFYLL